MILQRNELKEKGKAAFDIKHRNGNIVQAGNFQGNMIKTDKHGGIIKALNHTAINYFNN